MNLLCETMISDSVAPVGFSEVADPDQITCKDLIDNVESFFQDMKIGKPFGN